MKGATRDNKKPPTGATNWRMFPRPAYPAEFETTLHKIQSSD